MTIGVTGAAGFLGANLVRHLAGAGAAGARLVPFYSRRQGNPLTAGLRLSPVQLDVTSRAEVLERTRGLDVLFHLAGAVDYSRQGLRRTWDVNVKGAANVFEAVAANRIGRLVYVSSISVLGLPPAGQDLADESNDPYAAPGNPICFRDSAEALQAARGYCAGGDAFLAKVRVPYFDSKLAAYELAREYRRTHALPIVIAFPGTAVGAGDTGLSISRLVGLVFEGRLRFTLPGGTSFVAAQDVSEGLRLAWRAGRDGEGYILTGGVEDNLSYGQFMKRVARISRREYGRRTGRLFPALPAPLCRVAARIARVASHHAPSGAPSGAPEGAPGARSGGSLSEGLLLSGSVTHRFSGAKASRELGFHAGVSLDQAIRECIDFTLRHGGEGG